jgi:hypothetical protein
VRPARSSRLSSDALTGPRRSAPGLVWRSYPLRLVPTSQRRFRLLPVLSGRVDHSDARAWRSASALTRPVMRFALRLSFFMNGSPPASTYPGGNLWRLPDPVPTLVAVSFFEKSQHARTELLRIRHG